MSAEDPDRPRDGRFLDDDAWSAARTAARHEVKAIFARDPDAPLRRCPRCGREEQTRWETCPSCGWSYFARPPRLSRRARRLVMAGGLAMAATAAGLVLPPLLRQGEETRARQSARDRAISAAELRRLRREQRPRRGRPESLRPPAPGADPAVRLRARRALVAALERDITRDVRTRVARGELDGPIRETQCGPLARSKGPQVGDEEDLGKRIGRYDCVAVKADVRQRGRVVAHLGHPFVAAVDFRRFTYVWCKNNPPPGERGPALAVARLERACLAARGRTLGRGYVRTPDR